MLYDQDLPLFLWAKACSTAVYLQNRSPHRAVGSSTPEEAFTGSRPDVGHFRMFGCLTYSHVPSEKRTKLETTTEKGILVGYKLTTRRPKAIGYTFLPNESWWLDGMCDLRRTEPFGSPLS